MRKEYDMVTVTEIAQEKIAQALKENKTEAKGVRVFLYGGGWSGPSLNLALDEPKDSDSIFDNGGVQYIIDKDILKMTGDITIDFVTEGWQSGFTIQSQNPVAGSCGVDGTCSSQGGCS